MQLNVSKKTIPVKKREVIKYGKSWMRWLMLPVAFFSVLHFFNNPLSWVGYVVFSLSVGLFYLFKRARRLEHDDENFYIIRDKDEKIIHFSKIISIKRSAAKVNGSRYWILKYFDEFKKERKIRFFNDFFNKKFHSVVRAANPKVVIWTHPFFAHAEDNKHNPDYKE